MKTTFRTCILLWLCAIMLLTVAPAHAMLYWRVSVKVFQDSNGTPPRPADEPNYDTLQEIRNLFELINGNFDRLGWGIRLQLRELITINNNEWFNKKARDSDNRNQLEFLAKTQLNQEFRYQPDSINVYINNTSSGISGGHLPLIGDVVFMGIGGSSNTLGNRFWAKTFQHEVFHSLGLPHTQGRSCNGCPPDDLGACDQPGDDGLADTMLDVACWTTNDLALNNFGRIYPALNGGQQQQVDRAFMNIMSYHNQTLDVITHDQWELLVDTANLEKRNVASGRSVFVSSIGQGVSPCALDARVRELAEGLPGPVSWYMDELVLHPPSPELFIRRTCQNFSVNPPFPPRPPGYPNNWSWPPNLNIFPNPPPGYPSEWPWPPIDPAPVQVCIGGFKTVEEALACGTSDGDRIQIKAGNYNEILRITKPITLATDRGTVAIGRP